MAHMLMWKNSSRATKFLSSKVAKQNAPQGTGNLKLETVFDL